MFKKNKKMDYKSKLEHQLYLARENPEPIFDLTDCGLKNVPHGVYSLCRVFLKEVLLLGINRLEDLKGGGSLSDLKQLLILDIHMNNFNSLPNEIRELTNLRELYINDNHIKKLPDSITSLSHLKVMDASNNSLRYLPENLGDLVQLHKLNLTGNRHLNALPKSFCGLIKLKELTLDSENFKYPPNDVCIQGVETIHKFISEDCGIPYVTVRTEENKSNNSEASSDTFNKNDWLQEKFFEVEKLKEQKHQELLEIEKNNEMMQLKELELQNAMRKNKKKLLTDLVNNQSKLESALLHLQQEKDSERFRLIKQIQEEEIQVENFIKKLLEMNDFPMTQLLEQEAQEERRLIEAAKQNSNILSRQQVLDGMRNILEEEAKLFQNYSKHKMEVTDSILCRTLEEDDHLSHLLQSQDSIQANLVSQLQRDSELQKAAVCALLERSDIRSWSLIQQVNMVSTELAHLTAIEMNKKELQLNEHLNDLAQQRTNLSTLLLDLLSQQEVRKTQLLTTLKELEDIKKTSQEDFWLLQYQQLLERRPEIIDKLHNLDSELLKSLLHSGVIQYLPFLAALAYSKDALYNITNTKLLEAGITNQEDREKITDAINFYLNKNASDICTIISPEVEPSAPSEEASAPPMEQISSTQSATECVICLDHFCQIIIVPCGHMCTCIECSKTIISCPLCRSDIERKIQVILP